MKFKVGDRVRILKSPYDKVDIVQGSKGTVVETMNNGFVGIEFDENIHGHHCNKRCKDHFGWYCDENDVELLDEDIKVDTVKSILSPAMIVETREGTKYWVVLNGDKMQFVNDGWLPIHYYDDDLIDIGDDIEFDVMKIFRLKSNLYTLDIDQYCNDDLELVWERQEVQKPKLKEGMVIKTRDDEVYLVIKLDDELYFLSDNGYVFDFKYDEDFDEIEDFNDDIMFVFKQPDFDLGYSVFKLDDRNIIWKRTEF